MGEVNWPHGNRHSSKDPALQVITKAFGFPADPRKEHRKPLGDILPSLCWAGSTPWETPWVPLFLVHFYHYMLVDGGGGGPGVGSLDEPLRVTGRTVDGTERSEVS